MTSPRQPLPPQWASFRGLWSLVFPIMPWASDCFARLPLPWPLLGRIPEQSTLSLGAQGSGWSLMGPVPPQSPSLLACENRANNLYVAGRSRE